MDLCLKITNLAPMGPLLSICIPAYERPALLKRLLDSIAKQVFKDFEVIITDDSSSVITRNYYSIRHISSPFIIKKILGR